MNEQEKTIYKDRRKRLRERLGQGWLLLYKGGEHFNENLYYLTGLDTFYTVALISLETEDELLLVNSFEFSSIKVHCDISNVYELPSQDIPDRLISLLSEHHVSVLHCDYAFDARTPLPPELADQLRTALPYISIKGLPDELLQMRMIKEAGEIAIIKKGIEIVEGIFMDIQPHIRPGVSEADIAAEIYARLVRAGFNRFHDIFVASGTNSAIPFYRANNSSIPNNSVVLIDICAAIENYVVDMTRTFPTTDHFSQYAKVLYDAVKEAFRTACDQLGPGQTLRELSHVAKAVFAGHGLEKHYLNKIGHFVGLSPDDPGDADVPLEKGMIVTIEPGLYLPEEGLGIRVENTIVLESS